MKYSHLLLILFSFLQCEFPILSTKSDFDPNYENVKLKIAKPKPNHKKHLVAILAVNSGTETTDFIVPYSVLKRSEAFDVVSLSTEQGIIKMMPALQIQTEKTFEEFDNSNPEGADIIIVPAMHDSEDKKLIQWIKEQKNKSAMVLSICEGARVLANAGILKDQIATTHWYAYSDLQKQNPDTKWTQNFRYVQSENIISTSGVSASIPVSLALVESVKGKEVAENLAIELNVKNFSSQHDGKKFQLDWGYKFLVVKNTLAFWKHETIGIKIKEDVDELGLAIVSDAYSRTYRSNAISISDKEFIISKNGLKIISDSKLEQKVDLILSEKFLNQGENTLKESLLNIENRYGKRTAAFVALQLEYPYE